ncbi:hypothetical protein DXA15_08535 [Parabacteroides sp. AM58-2XD]|uniref:sigma-70 region 4 domain-containing protein n=1 Tax=Parabacteroides TaxID=375288 RepID=UPI000FE27732|nr:MULTISPECIES: sigma-70 region 4 domain-containing protein [Parabacteroides]RGY98978.1 hypothetical protein DXA15_08535 [Parabacteroides sp. AM58-2XD]GKG76445.1 hypothetical protein CE91St1_55880 [Parabacteroides goldsteinii]GKG80147.1 hypothetical protein CE91St2_33390 [Parabacteroides goldsteinii]
MEEEKNIEQQVTFDISYGKYSQAVMLYATTDMTGKEIAEQCGVSLSGFRVYLRRHYRELVLKRNNAEPEKSAFFTEDGKLRGKRGQTPAAHQKYKQAIEACDDFDYIEYNVSQIARMFGHDGTALRNQLRLHYPEILERREKARERLGFGDNFLRGVRPESVVEYAGAVELFRNTDRNLPSIAEECEVSLGGLSQYLRFYHKDLVKQKSTLYRPTANRCKEDKPESNGRAAEPSFGTYEKYRESVELYRTTHLTAKEIVARTGVTLEGFRNHLRMWHRDLMLERRGGVPEAGCNGYDLDLSQSKRYLKSTAAKYAPAIESLKARPRPVTHAAAEFGVDADTFRRYLRTHEPELAASLGKKKNIK